MSNSLQQFKLTNLIEQQKKNTLKIFHNIEKEINTILNSSNVCVLNPLYDSDWQNVEPVDIVQATTQVENYELPQRVPFEFTTNLEVLEVYLPFINIALLTKPVDIQKVIGVGAFTYSGLQEVLLKIYKWMGVISATSGLGTIVEVDVSGGSLPTKPSPTIPFPYYADCYDRTSYFISVSIQAQHASMSIPNLDPDGTTWANHTQNT
jgi:hypothetical protein